MRMQNSIIREVFHHKLIPFNIMLIIKKIKLILLIKTKTKNKYSVKNKLPIY